MANSSRNDSEPRTNISRGEAELPATGQKIDLIMRTLMLALACMLVLSVCVNVYIFQRNAALERTAERQRVDRQRLIDLYAFNQVLVRDLRALAQARDAGGEKVRLLLDKHTASIRSFGLDAEGRGLP